MNPYIDYNLEQGEREIQRISLARQYPVPKQQIYRTLHCSYRKPDEDDEVGMQLERGDNDFLIGFKDKFGNVVGDILLADYIGENIELWFNPNIVITSPTNRTINCIPLLLDLLVIDDNDDEFTLFEDQRVNIDIKIPRAIIKSINIRYENDKPFYHLNNQRTKVGTIEVSYQRFSVDILLDTIWSIEKCACLFEITESQSINKDARQDRFLYDLFLLNQVLEQRDPNLFNQNKVSQIIDRIVLNNTEGDTYVLGVQFEFTKFIPELEGNYNAIVTEFKYQYGETLIGKLKVWTESQENFFPYTLKIPEFQFPIIVKQDFLKFDPCQKEHIVDIYFDGINNPINEYVDYSIILNNSLRVFRNDDKTKFACAILKNDGTIIDNAYDFGRIECLQDTPFQTSIGLCRIEIFNDCDFNSKSNLIFKKPEVASVYQDVFDIESTHEDTFYKIDNGNAQKINFDINIDLQKAQNHINKFIEFDIKIEYFENERGELVDVGKFCKYSRLFQVTKFALTLVSPHRRSWICIDKGTSAIVVAQRKDGENSIVNLNSLQIERLELVDKPENEIYEYGTNLITSMFKFKPGGKLHSNKLTDHFYRFSPTISEALETPQYISPPIKSLIGHNKIYDRLLNYEADQIIEYYDTADDTFQKATKEILSPNKVIEESYKQLLTNYIPKGEYNYIFTYPNNFSRYHINKIREYYKTYFPESEILDISESDAALLSFINSPNFEISPESETYILIYDMGAGTLDITYAKVVLNKNYHRKVEVLGRTGCNLGGNYLDFLIAQILCKNNAKILEESVFLRKSGTESFELKKLITEKIKPDLATNSNIDTEITVCNTEISYNSSKILSDDSITTYVNDCTEKIIKDFKSFLPTGILDRIDVLVLTGRATQFSPIINKLQDTLRRGVKVVRDSGDSLKEIVAKGALQYATLFARNSAVSFINKNLYCSYGIIYINERNEEVYFELLHPISSRSTNITFEGRVAIYQYESEKTTCNFEFSSTIKIIQSYSADTLNDYRSGKENVQVLCSIDNEGAVHKNVDIRILINAKNEMVLWIGSSKSIITEQHTAISNNGQIFQGMMWPYWTN